MEQPHLKPQLMSPHLSQLMTSQCQLLSRLQSEPARMDDPQDLDVEITRTGYIEPGRPTVLAKCQEHLERRKVRFDVVDYTHMSIGEVFSGYLSQVHSSRDVEVDMVKQMHQKFEV